MKLRTKLYSTALASLAVAGGFLTSCEDDCVDCKCNMQVYDIVDAYDTENPLPNLRFDRTVIIRGEGLGSANRVEMIASDGTVDTTLYLRPTLVTNNAIILKMEGRKSTINTSALKIYSKVCQEPLAMTIECSGDPSIKGFFSEFVPAGGTLRIAGDYFYGTEAAPLQVLFEDESGNRIPGAIVGNTKTNIDVIVPAEAKKGSQVWVKTPIGETSANVLLNDESKVFLNFDGNCTAGAGRYGAVKDGAYTAGATNTYELGSVPAWTGNYGALTNHDNWSWNDYNTLSVEGQERNMENPEWGQRNLLDFSTDPASLPAYDYSNNNYVLKFEVFVPEDKPINHAFIFAFSEWGAEDEDGEHYNATTFYCWNYLANGGTNVLPAAVVVFDRNVVTVDADDQPACSEGGAKGFHTGGQWMTVAVPLTSTYFHVACQASGLFNKLASRKSPGHLEAKDFYNLWIFPDPNDRAEVTTNYFIAFDNFRIVEENGSGLLLGLYGQGTRDGNPAAKNDWFGMAGK